MAINLGKIISDVTTSALSSSDSSGGQVSNSGSGVSSSGYSGNSSFEVASSSGGVNLDPYHTGALYADAAKQLTQESYNQIHNMLVNHPKKAAMACGALDEMGGKGTGDAMMKFFNAPLPDKNSPDYKNGYNLAHTFEGIGALAEKNMASKAIQFMQWLDKVPGSSLNQVPVQQN